MSVVMLTGLLDAAPTPPLSLIPEPGHSETSFPGSNYFSIPTLLLRIPRQTAPTRVRTTDTVTDAPENKSSDVETSTLLKLPSVTKMTQVRTTTIKPCLEDSDDDFGKQLDSTTANIPCQEPCENVLRKQLFTTLLNISRSFDRFMYFGMDEFDWPKWIRETHKKPSDKEREIGSVHNLTVAPSTCQWENKLMCDYTRYPRIMQQAVLREPDANPNCKPVGLIFMTVNQNIISLTGFVQVLCYTKI